METLSSLPLSALTPNQLASVIEAQIRLQFAKNIREATPDELFRATAAALRPAIVEGVIESADRFSAARSKSLYYLSMEFLLGRSLSNNLQNLGIYELMDSAMQCMELRLADVLEAEPDAALGNGGLGRLAACFLDSLASLHMAGDGYGDRKS